jgi:hypothetical protein
MAYDPNELLTLADQLRLLVQQGMGEDEAKARLTKLFGLRGRSIYSPKYAVSYEGATIDWETGLATLRRLPRQPFTPWLTAAEHFALFPQRNVTIDPIRPPEPAGVVPGNAPASVKPSPPPTKRAAFTDWIARRFPGGIPAGTSAKRLARDFKQDKGVTISARTVRRALGGN